MELFEEHDALHEDMLELQENLEEAGLWGELEDDGPGKSKGGGIPGGKKVLKILKKTLKKANLKKKMKKKKQQMPQDEGMAEPPQE